MRKGMLKFEGNREKELRWLADREKRTSVLLRGEPRRLLNVCPDV